MKFVIIGASAAGLHAVYVLRMLNKEAEIVILSEDRRLYSKCNMHYYMVGKKTMDGLNFMSENFIEDNKITWKKGISVTAVYPEKNQIETCEGDIEEYDKLLIASGAYSFIPPIAGIDKATNVCGFRSIEDCERIMELSKKSEHIVILGAGLVGVDVVCGLMDTGADISMIDTNSHLLAVQLDSKASHTYQARFAEKGVKFYFDTSIKELKANSYGDITAVILKNDEEIPCDLLVVSAGVRANISFLENSGLELDGKGLVIDKQGRTNIDNIYGAGDVTGKNLIWPVAVKEGVVAAVNMSGLKSEMTDYFYGKSWMNFFDIPTLSYGIHELSDNSYGQEIEGGPKGYRRIIYKDKKVEGAIVQGDISYTDVLNILIHDGIKLPDVKKKLLDYTGEDFIAPRN